MAEHSKSGWVPTLTLGQFREKTKDLPDYTVMMGEFEEELKYNECTTIWLFHETDNQPPVLVLEGGQIVNYEYDMDARDMGEQREII